MQASRQERPARLLDPMLLCPQSRLRIFNIAAGPNWQGWRFRCWMKRKSLSKWRCLETFSRHPQLCRGVWFERWMSNLGPQDIAVALSVFYICKAQLNTILERKPYHWEQTFDVLLVLQLFETWKQAQKWNQHQTTGPAKKSALLKHICAPHVQDKDLHLLDVVQLTMCVTNDNNPCVLQRQYLQHALHCFSFLEWLLPGSYQWCPPILRFSHY